MTNLDFIITLIIIFIALIKNNNKMNAGITAENVIIDSKVWVIQCFPQDFVSLWRVDIIHQTWRKSNQSCKH